MEGFRFSLALCLWGVEEIREFLQNADVIQTLNDPKKMYLHGAVVDGRAEIVKELLDAGASPNVVPTHGDHSLIEAVERGKQAIVDLLLRAGADVDVIGVEGYTAVGKARTPGMAKLLLAAGADVRRPGAEPCLLIPATRGYLDVVKVLLEAGAEVVDTPAGCWGGSPGD